MRRSLLILSCCLLFATEALAFELDIGFSVGNRRFLTDRSADSDALSASDYSRDLDIGIAQPVAEGVDVGFGYTRDPILRNRVTGTVSYGGGFFRVGAGPVFGTFNTSEQPLTLGLQGFVYGELAGVVFLSIEGGASLGGTPSANGEYSQNQSSISLGFYVPNAIVAGNLRDRRYRSFSGGSLTTDRVTQYALSADLFKKNVPYNLLLDFAYEEMERVYESLSRTHRVGSLVIGGELSFDLTRRLALELGIESAVFAFGQDYLAGFTSGDSFFFTGRLGTTLRFN